MKRKKKGWHNEPGRHALASKGIKTVLDDIWEHPQRKFLNIPRQKMWIKERRDKTSYKQEIKQTAQKWYDEIQEMVDSYTFRTKHGRIINRATGIQADLTNFLSDKNGQCVEDVHSWMKEKMEEMFEPYMDWVEKELDEELSIEVRNDRFYVVHNDETVGGESLDWGLEEDLESQLHYSFENSEYRSDFVQDVTSWYRRHIELVAENISTQLINFLSTQKKKIKRDIT